MKRRLLFIPCDLRMDKNPEKKIPDINRKVEAELSGIFNLCLAALANLEARGNEFEEIPESEILLAQMANDASPVREFFNHYMEKSEPDKEVTVADVYSRFQEEMECGENRKNISKRDFCMQLQRIGKESGLTTAKVRRGKTTPLVYPGWVLKDMEGVVINARDKF